MKLKDLIIEARNNIEIDWLLAYYNKNLCTSVPIRPTKIFVNLDAANDYYSEFKVIDYKIENKTLIVNI